MTNKTITLALALCAMQCATAQDFDKHFADSTLRLNYIFAGNATKQQIYVDELCCSPKWYGRKERLAETPLEGNGQITVKAHGDGTPIYRLSFSTLFQEWLSTPEAQKADKSFENAFLIPYPKEEVDVTVELFDNRRRTVATYTHTVSPSDILIRRTGFSHVTPYETLQKAADTTKCIHIAFVAEGYQSAEMPQFVADARTATEALFAHEPFKSQRHLFNIVAVMPPSADSGVSIPANGEWKSTALGSHFSTFYTDRYLTTLRLKTLHDILAGTPYEHIIILANTDNYGGGGIYNSYTLTAADHSMFKPVVVHEFGHSFGGLADEYYYDDQYEEMYPTDVEPWEKNITTLVDFSSKWKNLLPENVKIPTPPSNNEKDIYTKIGVYEGGGYQSKGVYRAFQECRMKINEAPAFCKVCQNVISNLITYYTE